MEMRRELENVGRRPSIYRSVGVGGRALDDTRCTATPASFSGLPLSRSTWSSDFSDDDGTLPFLAWVSLIVVPPAD